MSCNFHAVMSPHFWGISPNHRVQGVLRGALAGVALLGALVSAGAADVDRKAPLNYEADTGRADLARKVYTLKGNVLITQAALTIRADDAQVRQADGGQALVTVSGAPARFEQKAAAGKDEVLAGQAQRIEYDARTGVVKFTGQAVLRRLRGTQLVDEVTGPVITYHRDTEEFQVQGSAAPGADTGRVRGVLTPGSTP